jgi:isoleucyl-tRNA synthetase
MWQNLVRRVDAGAPESVHLARWPDFDEALIDEALSVDMQVVRDVVALGLQARNANKLKVRQPLGKVEIILGKPALGERVAAYASLICDELNVKDVVLTQDAHHVSFALKPNFRALGPIFGAKVQLVKKALDKVDAKAVRALLATEGAATIALEDGTEAKLDAETIAVSVTPAAGWVAAAGEVGVVILDGTLTEALVDEGRAREVLSRIQAWRKDANLDYTARIRVGITGDEALVKASQAFVGMLASESLAVEVTPGVALSAPTETREAEVDGLSLVLTLAQA